MFKYVRIAKLNKFNTRWINSSRIIRNDVKKGIWEATQVADDNRQLDLKTITPSQPSKSDPLNTSNINSAEINDSNQGSAQHKEDVKFIDELSEDDYLTTIFEKMEPYMDTYEVYKQLQTAGFSESQSTEIINLIVFQLNFKLSKLSTKYSQLVELENERYLFESAQQELRVDITRSREIHINELINLINLLERDFNIISDELNNDFIQLKNNNEVTINDQKQENTLSSKKIMLKIQESNHKITTELNSAMRSEIESLRWHLSRWGLISILVCIFSGCATFYVFKKNENIRETTDEFVPLVIYEPLEIEDDYDGSDESVD